MWWLLRLFCSYGKVKFTIKAAFWIYFVMEYGITHSIDGLAINVESK